MNRAFDWANGMSMEEEKIKLIRDVVALYRKYKLNNHYTENLANPRGLHKYIDNQHDRNYYKIATRRIDDINKLIDHELWPCKEH